MWESGGQTVRRVHQDGLFDLHTVLEGSCVFLIDSSVDVITDPRTVSLAVLVASIFGGLLWKLLVHTNSD